MSQIKTKKGIMVGILLFVCGTFTACSNSGSGTSNNIFNGSNINNVNSRNDSETTHTHTMIYHEAQSPESACVGTGNYEYWECTGCDKYFYDSEGISEYADKSDVIIVAHHDLHKFERNEPTCIKQGSITFWQCFSCDAYFTDREATNVITRDDIWIPALGHNYVSHDAKSASHNIAGWNTYHTCTRCEYTTQSSFYTPHVYSDNTYTCIYNCGRSLTPTAGLKYELNDDGQTYTLAGIGTATDTQIVIPYTYEGKQVTAIKQWAFESCKEITSVFIPNGVTSIGWFAFYECTKLKSIEIPSSVSSIGEQAFSMCSSLERVVIPNGVTNIEKETFSRCQNLQCIEIPNSVTSIGDYAFLNCNNLARIDFAGTKLQWDAITKLYGWDSASKDSSSIKDYLVYCTDATFTPYGDIVA